MEHSNDPVYTIILVDKDNKKRKTYAGVAFAGQFDSLTIVLNPGIVIDGRVAETCWINMVPYRRFDRREAQSTVNTSGGTPAGSDSDDIPF